MPITAIDIILGVFLAGAYLLALATYASAIIGG